MVNLKKDFQRKIKICVSGAAETGHCGEGALEMAQELGRQIALHGCDIVTGATTGFPLWSAKGAKEVGGFSIGLSPAFSEKEHIEKYKLPLDYLDQIIYTGEGYAGRDILLTRSADAVILGCGRVGTIHEFTVSFEDNKPVGILRGPWFTDEIIQSILDNAYRPHEHILFDDNSTRLVERLIEMVEKGRGN